MPTARPSSSPSSAWPRPAGVERQGDHPLGDLGPPSGNMRKRRVLSRHRPSSQTSAKRSCRIACFEQAIAGPVDMADDLLTAAGVVERRPRYAART
jgi:hypothetical protein